MHNSNIDFRCHQFTIQTNHEKNTQELYRLTTHPNHSYCHRRDSGENKRSDQTS